MKQTTSISAFALTLALLIHTQPAHGEGGTGNFSDASQRLMTVQLSSGQTVSENLPIYPLGRKWFLPLGEVARNLGLDAEVVPSASSVEATSKSGKPMFSLSAKECLASRMSEPLTFQCVDAVVHDDEIYVELELLEKLLPVRVDINSYRSEVTIETLEGFVALPAGMPKRRLEAFDPGYPRVEIPTSNFEGLFVDQQVGYFTTRSSSKATNEFRHDSAITGELLGMEGSAFIDGKGDVVQNQRYTLAKKRVDGGLLGGLSAREYQLIDVTFPSLPMIGGGGIFRGGLVSSYPLSNSTQFGSRDFNGDLPAGWEVELYQNDVLIDRRSSNNGRYEFKNIALTYGENRFRLAFYGPQGQRRESFETYSIDSSFLKPGESAYRAAFADDAGANARWLMQYDKSLGRGLNVFSAASRFAVDKNSPLTTYGLLGVRGYFKNILLSSSAASSEFGGTAWENAVQAPLQNTSIGAGYARLSNFFTEIYKPERGKIPLDVYRGNVAFDVFRSPTVRFNFETSHTTYQDQTGNNVLTSRVSTKTGPLAWFNTLNFDQGAQNQTGELASIASLGAHEVRLTLGYDNQAVRTSDLEAQTHLTDVFTVGAGWIETFNQGLRKEILNLTRQFRHVALTANASLDNQGGFAVGALLSYSIGREPRENSWSMQAKPEALLGAVSVFAFLDLNQNGIRDTEEPVFEGAEVVLNQRPTGIKTSKTGIAVIGGLPTHEPADVSLSAASFPNAQMRPVPKGVRVYPRAGSMAKIDLPIIVYSEVAGFVRVRTNGVERPKRGLRVTLRDANRREVKSVQTDADGFYLIDDIRAGVYTLELDTIQLRGLRLRASEPAMQILVSPQGISDDNRDFSLVPVTARER